MYPMRSGIEYEIKLAYQDLEAATVNPNLTQTIVTAWVRCYIERCKVASGCQLILTTEICFRHSGRGLIHERCPPGC